MKAELLTRTELAARFGVDVRTITNWLAAGLPQRMRSSSPVYSWPECLKWREQQIREDARATREVAGDEGMKTEMAELRLRTARAEAESAELELAERRGKLVTVDFMASEFARITDNIRAELLKIPAAWTGPLDGCTTTAERQIVLQDAVNAILPQLGAAADDDGEPADTPDDPILGDGDEPTEAATA